MFEIETGKYCLKKVLIHEYHNPIITRLRASEEV